jgi:hypothetical protein
LPSANREEWFASTPPFSLAVLTLHRNPIFA